MSSQPTIEAITALLNDLQNKCLAAETELAAKQREVEQLRQAVEAAQLVINLLDARLTTPTTATSFATVIANYAADGSELVVKTILPPSEPAPVSEPEPTPTDPEIESWRGLSTRERVFRWAREHEGVVVVYDLYWYLRHRGLDDRTLSCYHAFCSAMAHRKSPVATQGTPGTGTYHIHEPAPRWEQETYHPAAAVVPAPELVPAGQLS